MHTFFRCEYCDYTSNGGTIGDHIDMEAHEASCEMRPCLPAVAVLPSSVAGAQRCGDCPGGVYYIEHLDSETVRLIPRR